MNRDLDYLLLSFNFLIEKLAEHNIKIDKSEMKRYCIDEIHKNAGLDKMDVLFDRHKKDEL